MSITPEQIDRWRAVVSEYENLEFKEAKQTFNLNTLYEYCMAIANEKGGYLLLGITNTPPRDVVGSGAFPNIAKVSEQILNKCKFRVDVEAVDHPGGRVVIFSIPSRPPATPLQLDGRYLMRSGESLLAMTTEQIKKVIDEEKIDWLQEYSKTGLSADDVLALLDTQSFCELLKIRPPTDAHGIVDRLEQERLIDELNGRLAIRRIGAILIARSLRDFPELELKAPRVCVYNDATKNNTKLDVVGARGYATGFAGLIRFVGEQLPQNEVIEGAFSEKSKLVPDVVLRELLANALIHQDFSISGARVMVDIYTDRIEISNPGQPLLPVNRFADENRSRNERLADLMRRIRVCEAKGSGIDRVLQLVEAYQLPAPSFRADEYRTKVTIWGPKTFDELSPDARIDACYWHCALRWVTGERMTNQSLRERFKLPESSSSSVSQVIATAVKGGFIKRDPSVGGSYKYACYMPIWA